MAENTRLDPVDMIYDRIENQAAIAEYPQIRAIGIIGNHNAARGFQLIFGGKLRILVTAFGDKPRNCPSFEIFPRYAHQFFTCHQPPFSPALPDLSPK
jgi:hypothetical protein